MSLRHTQVSQQMLSKLQNETNYNTKRWNNGKKETKSQSRSECYLTRERDFDHKLKTEKGRHKKINPKENRICGQCSTEMHFLLQCKTFNETRNIYFDKFKFVMLNFKELSTFRMFRGGVRADLPVSTCHSLKDSETETEILQSDQTVGLSLTTHQHKHLTF